MDCAPSDDVDGKEHEDPHHVDEVPVDPADLDSVVMVGREVPAEGADRHEEQDCEPDEDVAAVQARQAEEDRREGAVAGVEADAQVLRHLCDEERQSHQERQQQARAQAEHVALLHRRQRPVHGERGRHEDQRVDERHVDRQMERRGRPLDAVDDPHEEVRGEERAEEHDLRPDEQVHPEDRRRDARRVVRLGRMLLVVVEMRFGVRDHQAFTNSGTSTSTCSTGSFVSVRRRSSKLRRSQPDRSPGNVETITSSTRSSSIVCATAEYGSGCEIWPWTSMPSPRSRWTACRRRRSAASYEPSVSPCGEMMRKLAFPCAARSRIFWSSGSPSTVWFATTRTFLSPLSDVRSTTTCWNGRSPATRRICSTALRRSQLDCSCGCVETVTSSGWSWAIPSRSGDTGSHATTTAVAFTPCSRSRSSVLSRRRRAAARRVS